MDKASFRMCLAEVKNEWNSKKSRGKRGGETTKYSGSFSAMNRHSQRANLATSIPEITQGSQIQTTVIRNGNDVVP